MYSYCLCVSRIFCFGIKCIYYRRKLITCCLFVSGGAQLSEISRPVSFQTVKPGDSTTIECDIKSEFKNRVWYKLTTGNRLLLLAEFETRYRTIDLPEEFPPHYSVKFNIINSHLSISATVWEDVGTYFCGGIDLTKIEFGSGTFLMVKGIIYFISLNIFST